MPNDLRITGLELLKADLARLPEELRVDADARLLEAATTTQHEIAAVYALHRVSGALEAGLELKTDVPDVKGRVRTRVVSRALHAYYFEFGTRRSRAFPTLVPIARVHRQAAYRAILEHVRAQGLTVRGDTT